jgi:hypothetical protein
VSARATRTSLRVTSIEDPYKDKVIDKNKNNDNDDDNNSNKTFDVESPK